MSRDLLAYLILAFLALTWGTSYLLIKKALLAFTPQQVASLRLVITGAAFLPFLVVRFKKHIWKKWAPLLVVGLTGSAFPALCFSFAQTKLNSSLAGIFSSLT